MNTYPGKILVVEENKEQRSFLRDFLNSSGYRVTEINSIAAAADTALGEVPDLIFMDLASEESVETLYKLRQKKELSIIPVLVSSADGGFGIELYSNIDKFGNGFIGYLTNPLNLSDLADQIKAIILK